ncbi:MAG: exosortase C-terminal domain/associated protein EpsI [Thermoguttaceae bacterium]|jgi:EpsI family protein
MRGNIAIRIIVAAAIIAVTYLGMYVVAWGIQVPEVILPSWNVKDLPKQLGEWKGEDVKLDERLFQATDATSIVERQYHNELGMVISIHLAVFKDPNKGIWHNPVSCYDSAGWVPVEITRVPISETREKSDKIALSTWEKSGETTIVGYWYQLGEHRLYGRWDLGFSVRWQMRGRKTWPALIKILLSTGAGSKPENTKIQLLKFADLVHQWINQPGHQSKDESAATVLATSK